MRVPNFSCVGTLAKVSSDFPLILIKLNVSEVLYDLIILTKSFHFGSPDQIRGV